MPNFFDLQCHCFNWGGINLFTRLHYTTFLTIRQSLNACLIGVLQFIISRSRSIQRLMCIKRKKNVHNALPSKYTQSLKACLLGVLQFIISWCFSIDKMYDNVYQQLNVFNACTKPNTPNSSPHNILLYKVI